MRSMICLAAAGILAGSMAVQGWGLGVESGSVGCFDAGEFGDAEGICITRIPDGGELTLAGRRLLPGDVLTAEQAAQMTFVPEDTELDRAAALGYLPVSAGSVGQETQLTISIHGRENKPPIAEDSAAESYKNLEITGHLKASDPEGRELTYTLVRAPRRGSVELHPDGSFTYTPKKNKVGTDSFTYTAADPMGKTSREATVTVNILKPSGSPQYSDTLGRDCRFSAEWMKNTGIFAGEQVGGKACFCPDRAVTRGEFVTMLVKALDLKVEDSVTYTGYEDVPGWLRPYLAAALRSGLADALPRDQTFRPDQPITGAEAADLLCAVLEQPQAIPTGVLNREQTAMVLYQAVSRASVS